MAVPDTRGGFGLSHLSGAGRLQKAAGFGFLSRRRRTRHAENPNGQDAILPPHPPSRRRRRGDRCSPLDGYAVLALDPPASRSAGLIPMASRRRWLQAHCVRRFT